MRRATGSFEVQHPRIEEVQRQFLDGQNSLVTGSPPSKDWQQDEMSRSRGREDPGLVELERFLEQYENALMIRGADLQEINDRKQTQLDNADFFLGIRFASDKTIMEDLNELFSRIVTWLTRYSGAAR